jgi:hypothetical protein
VNPDTLHIIVTIAVGVGGALWGVAKFTASKYSATVEQIDHRLKEVEREYITRASVEQTIGRVEDKLQQGLQRIHSRLDDMYRDIHMMDIPRLKQHRESD